MINITRRFRDAVLKVAGGAANLMPKVTVTVVNPTQKDIAVWSGVYEYIDGSLINYRRHLIKAGESKAIEGYVAGYYEYDNWYQGTDETKIFEYSNFEGVDEDNVQYFGLPSNPVNMNIDTFTVIDPTKPASYTATLTVD